MLLNKTDPAQVERYNHFVRTSPYAFFTQDMSWAKVKSNWIPEYIYLEDESGNIRASLSVLMVEAVPGKMLMYASRGPLCDFYDMDTVEELISEAGELAKKYNAFLLRMDPLVREDDDLVQKYRDKGYIFRSKGTPSHSFIQPRCNMMFDLEGLPADEDVISILTSKERTKARRSYKDGVKTHFSVGENVPDDELQTFYDLTEIMAARQGITHRPKEYFERLLKAYPDSRLYSSDLDGEVLCSSICIPYGEYVHYIYSASSNARRNVRSVEQMLYEELQWTHSMGKRYLDLGGIFEADESDSLYLFKRGLTGEKGLVTSIGELDVVYDREAYEIYVNR